ncbi:MAG TPA: tRNA (adenosine(37)-N6)-threonylcarbamoyltransferase complex dimerization subunit type 1 TsaB [Micrococcaceae bacterium]|nr:tRNA (adenosine(37)-N6)-threonylcarbamoyltransferase complex dimerization subunit type 1 TsaB [Micrococcaceae bacterium]
MRILSIDTSAIASAALISVVDGKAEVLASFATEDTRSHAEVLAPGVDSLFNDPVAEGPLLDAIVVGVGPGPFTGLRSGIAMARTLSFAWNVPLHGMMSLDALAWDVLGAGYQDAETKAGVPHPDRDFVIATDARRKEVYWARYSGEGALLDGPHVGPATDVPALPVYGMGAGLYAETLEAQGSRVDSGFAQAQPTAASLGLSAAVVLHRAGFPGPGHAKDHQLRDSTPLYLRESDAQVPGPRKRAL